MKFYLGVISFCIFSLGATAPAHALEELTFGDDNGSGGGGGGGSTGGGTSGTGTSGSGTSSGGSAGIGNTNAAAPIAISIPCLADDGHVAGGGAQACPGILAKCTDLKRAFETNIKSTLSLKIWGYYNNKDIDLDKSSLDQLVGTAMPNPICSVVGHKLQYSSAANDLEITKQSIGQKLECGKHPSGRGDHSGGVLGFGASDKIILSFNGSDGGQWGSYMLGVYPWLIRKHASDVLTTIRPDLSNMSDVIKTNSAFRADIAVLNQRMNGFYRDLSTEARSACGQTDLVTKCKTGAMSVTDPSNRLCTLVKAQEAITAGALPNVIIQEIMARVQKDYDQYFSGMLARSNPDFNRFFDACTSGSGNGFLGMQPRKKYSCAASCLFDGQDYYTWADYGIQESGGEGRSSRRCELPTKVSLVDGAIRPSFSFGVGPTTFGGGPISINKGFAGFIEYLIRNKICGQHVPSDVSVCDTVGIPDKPEKAK